MRLKSKLITASLILLTLGLSFSSCEKDEIDTIEKNTENLPAISGYPIVGTNQSSSFDNLNEISLPSVGEEFYGQNSNYPGTAPKYVDNGDGTVTDMVTGLMWQQSFDHNEDGVVNYQDNLTYDELISLVENGVTFAGYNDWRLPTIKEMYSLILFSGRDIMPEGTSTDGFTPFIDNQTFEFSYGDLSAGERLIDVQCATTDVYVSNEVPTTVFGVNFADGRIKGYGTTMPGSGAKAFDYLLVRGNSTYGINEFQDNGDGTITDQATGLMWMQDDNGEAILWKDALAYAEGKEFASYSDWRLPDAKELQSIVDYTRSPASTNSAAINPLFNCTQITNEAGQDDYPWYWSNTTHKHEGKNEGNAAVYLSFGKSLGNMPVRPQGSPPQKTRASGEKKMKRPSHLQTNIRNQKKNWIDIHGAGSQRSDPKSGDPNDFLEGRGPQGDAIRIYNYARLVRNIN